MKTRHPFQFNASPRTPAAWQQTMMEVVEVCNSRFRPFYRRAVDDIISHAEATGCTHIAELGAGNAPITQRLLKDPRANRLRFTVCDNLPKPDLYRRLQTEHPNRVTAINESFDFTQPHLWEPGTLLVLTAAFHHVHQDKRAELLRQLTESADGVLLFAPVRKTLGCLLAGFATPIPAWLTPFLLIHRPGRLRRWLWCTLVPVVPLLMLWDGVGGCLRQWSREDWQKASECVSLPRPLEVRETRNMQTVIC